MTRTFATLPESLQVAQYYAKRNVTNIKAELEPSRYQVIVNGQTRNVDYRIIEAMMFALQPVASVPAKPKRQRRTATSKPSLPEMGE